MTKVLCNYRKPNKEKLQAFGFLPQEDRFLYRTTLAEEQMVLTVQVTAKGEVFTQVTDRNSGEEYVLHLITGAAGAVVGQVRSDYEKALETVFAACFDAEVFKAPQTKGVLAYAKETYGDEPEHLWETAPENAILRRKDNQKWYAAILTVSRRKLGLDSDERVEILNLQMDPQELADTVDHLRYFPAFHMNKKHWVSLCMDGTLSTEELCRRLDESYRLAFEKNGRKLK